MPASCFYLLRLTCNDRRPGVFYARTRDINVIVILYSKI